MASVALGKPDRTRATRISAADAATLVRSGDWVEYGTGLSQPDVFDAALAARVEQLEDVKIRACLTVRPRAVLEADPAREHFHWLNWHYTGYDRAKGDAGCADYIPCNLGEIPDYYRRFIDRRTSRCSRPARRTSTGSTTSASRRSGTVRSSSAPRP